MRLCRLALALVVCWDAVEKWPLVPAFYENQRSSYPTFALAEARSDGPGMVARMLASWRC